MALGKRQAPSHEEQAPKIRISTSTYQKAAIRKGLTQLLLVFGAFLLVYVALAASILRIVPATEGFTLIKNNSFPGGRAPADSVLMISTTSDQGDTASDRLFQSFVPQSDTAIVKVLAGPSGALQWSSNGILEVNDQELPVVFPVNPNKEFLDNEYIAICLKGACNVGEPLFFSSARIYGIPVGKSDFEKGVNLDDLKNKMPGSSSRPAPEELAVWVKGTNPGMGEAKLQCVSTHLYQSDVADSTLRFLVDEMISGRIAKPTPEDQTKIDAVYSSKEVKQCGNKKENS